MSKKISKILSTAGLGNIKPVMSRAIRAAGAIVHYHSAATGEGSTTSIFVGNLPEEATAKDLSQTLWNHFRQFGQIKKNGVSVKLPANSKPFGFVDFFDEEAVENALKAPGFMIGDHTIVVQRRLTERKAKSAAFSDEVPVCQDLVLSLYRKKNNDLAAGIHGYWFCNIINGSILITLKNEENVPDQLTDEIEKMVDEKFKNMNQRIVMLWRPPGRKTSAPKHLLKQTKKHNVYNGKIFSPTCIEEATSLAEPYTSDSGPLSLFTFFNEFMNRLRIKISDDPSVRRKALYEFSKYAKEFYGRELRITVKTAYQVDIGFLSDDAKNPIDHILSNPEGEAADFAQFCNI